MNTKNLLGNSRSVAFSTAASALALMVLIKLLPNFTLFADHPADHLSLHLVLEMFAVVVSVMVVSMAWHTLSDEGMAMSGVLIYGFTVVAGVDLIHALTYEGMPALITEGSTAKAVFFWLSGRTAEALTVLLIALRIRLPGSRRLWLLLGLITVATLFMVGTFYLQRLPTLFVPGVGVTPFKVRYEYGLCALNMALALALYWQSRGESQPQRLWLATACFVTGVGELAFTTYVSSFDFENVFGHLYKAVAYGFIYRATFLEGVRAPHLLLTETKQRLRKRQEELDALVRNVPVGIARLDGQLSIRYVNAQLLSHLGGTLEQHLGQPWNAAAAPPLQAKSMAVVQRALTGYRTEQDFEFRSANGSTVWIYAIAVPDRNAQGEVDGVLAIFTETTEREHARQLLADSLREKAELNLALDAHAIVAVTDANGVITRVNDKFCTISQYGRSELIGQTHRLINSGHHPKEFFEDLWHTISMGNVWNGEICNRAKDGSLYWVHTTVVPFIGEDGLPVQYIAIRADITQRKVAEQEATRMAYHDPLTGLPNRRLMGERLKQAIKAVDRDRDFGALLLLDLDHFKEINDTFGHAQGDVLLQNVARRLQGHVRSIDTVARLGGDEFVIILGNLGRELQAATNRANDVAQKVREMLAIAHQLQGEHVISCASVGVVMIESASQDADELLKHADMALYQAKDSGRNQISFFDPSLQESITRRASLLKDLRQALQRQELEVHYQPVVDSERHILGVEALIRWRHSERGMVSPAEFIPLCEQTDLILSIGQWVLETACQQLSAWAPHPVRGQWTIAVNVSARQFQDAQFVANVRAALARSGGVAQRLRLELTESMLQSDLDLTIAKMHTIRALGVRFSLDDFGTGFSSLSYLKKLPLDQLKIDKSFVNDVLSDASDAAIARSILTMAQSLGLGVVAEGVEEPAQMDFLVSHGCRAFQGYLFSRPLPVHQLGDAIAP